MVTRVKEFPSYGGGFTLVLLEFTYGVPIDCPGEGSRIQDKINGNNLLEVSETTIISVRNFWNTGGCLVQAEIHPKIL